MWPTINKKGAGLGAFYTSFTDPDPFDADLDPAFHFDMDPDPTI
jgi:hypothetical protein